MEVEFTGSAFYTTECNFSLVSSSNQIGGVSINIPPNDNFILRSRFNLTNASNLSFAFTDTSNTISTYIRQSTNSILLSSNEGVITTCNFVPVNNSNYEIAIRRRFGETKFFINDEMFYDHTTPFTFDELNGKFEITGFSRCNLPSMITVDDVEIIPITTHSNLTEFVADVKIATLYCDNIVSASSNVIINNPITTNTIVSSNISANSISISNISFSSNQIITLNSNSVVFSTPLYSSNVSACNIIFSATQSNIVDNVWTIATTSNVDLGTIPQRIYNVEYGLGNTTNKAIWGSNTASWTSNALQEYIATDSNGDQTVTITNNSSSTQTKTQTGKDANGNGFIKWLFSAIGSATISTTITMAATGIIINGQSIMDWGATGVNIIQNTLSKMTVDFANNLLDGVNAIKTTAGKYVMNNFTRATGEQGIRLLSDQIRVGAYSIHIDGDSNIIAITDSNSSSNVYFGLDKCYMMNNLGIGLSNPLYRLDVNGDIYSSSNMYEAGQLLNIRYAPSNHTHDFSTTYAPSNAMSNWDWGSNTAFWSSNNTSNLPTLYATSNAMSNWDWGSNTALWSSNNTSNLPTLYAPSNAMSNWNWGSNTAFWSSNALSNYSVNTTLSNYGLKTQTDWTSNSLSNYALTSHTHDYSTVYAPSNAMSNWNWGSNTALWTSNALSNYALSNHTHADKYWTGGTNLTYTSCNVDIGTSSPTQKLDVRGKSYFEVSTNTGLYVFNTDISSSENPAEIVFERYSFGNTQKGAVGMDKSGRDFFIWVNGSDRLNITTDGNIGIGGQPSTLYKLDVKGKVRTLRGVHIEDGYDGLYLWGNCNVNYKWNISHDVGGEGDSCGNLNFYADTAGANTLQNIAFIEDDVGAGAKQLNFTGSHRVVEEGANIDPDRDFGLIVVASGKYNSLLPEVKKKQIDNITMDEALPTIKTCSKRKDKAVFGVISEKDSLTKDGKRRIFHQGNFKSCIRKGADDKHLKINSLGEGAVWVCDTNGNFENGDFITTSTINGYGEKQDEPYVCNYTLGKITCDVDWSEPNLDKKFQVRIVNGHKAVFVGCIYMCCI